MTMSGRKLKILQAIIHNYIVGAEPVGSRTISKRYDLGVSPATIRNEMSDLEDSGYLVQPYTSAGRIPSDKAYRLYVNSLIKSKQKDLEIKKRIKSQLLKEIDEIQDLIQHGVRILSQLSNYTSIAIAPQIGKSKLKRVQLVPIDNTKILVVIVTDSGMVKDVVFRIDKEISTENLNIMSNLLTEKLKGKEIKEIDFEVESEIIGEMYNLRNVLKRIIPLINQSIDHVAEIDLYSNGLTNIFNFPEYNNVDKAKAFISFLENKNTVIDMLVRSGFKDISISIGNENKHDQIKNCSLITATYELNGKTIGKIGVIGPTRMDYSNAISVVKSMALNLNDILEEYFTD